MVLKMTKMNEYQKHLLSEAKPPKKSEPMNAYQIRLLNERPPQYEHDEELMLSTEIPSDDKEPEIIVHCYDFSASGLDEAKNALSDYMKKDKADSGNKRNYSITVSEKDSWPDEHLYTVDSAITFEELTDLVS